MRSILGRSPKRRIRRNAARPTVYRTGASQRTGTVMVFVLGILTLLALIGIGLIASTRMDAKRVDNQSNVTSTTDSINAIVKQLQETLRQDIWGAANSTIPLNSGNAPSAINLGIPENNEPYDAPGASDRWLSSLMPYNKATVPVSSGSLHTGNVAAQISSTVGEKDVLIWPEVSYLGSDLLLPKDNTSGGSRNEFAWPYNTRNAPVILSFSSLVRYGPTNELPTSVNDSLRDVPVMQTWPPRPGTLVNGADGDWVYEQGTGPEYPMVPGSTTNVPIRRAQTRWNELASLFGSAALPPGFTPKFPYFDTNGDGIVDLYDADGDGVPDSPISFVLDGNSSNPQSPSKLYGVVRVIDHGGMLNANVASSFSRFSSELMFDESNSNLQRRGRRATELLLDNVCNRADTVPFGGNSNRSWQVTNYRTRNTSWINDPFNYDLNVVRRDLIGGSTGNFGYRLFGLPDEASLRHRFSLTPAAYANYRKGQNNQGFDKIDTALCWSLLWSNTLVGSYPNQSYEQNLSRWSRMNADFQPYGNAPTYEGWDINTVNNIGWRRMMTEDEPFSIRRPMFTTISRDVMMPPADLTYDPGIGLNQLPPTGLPVTWHKLPAPVTMVQNDPTDPWPMVPISTSVPAAWMRLLPIDVNMTATSATAAAAAATQASFMKYMASAMFLALSGVGEASGLVTDDDAKRMSFAWQFAANVADYRDSDGEPSTIELPTGQFVYGLEKQPFFTEAYCHVDYKVEPDPNPSDDDWFDAVELFIPPTWMVNIDKLYLRTPGSGSGPAAGIALSSFTGVPAALDGNGISLSPTSINTGGMYYVFSRNFCGAHRSELAGRFHFFERSVPSGSQQSLDGRQDRTGLFRFGHSGVDARDRFHRIAGRQHRLGPQRRDHRVCAGLGGAHNATDHGSERFSLARSTKGWRFTVARYQLLDTTDDTISPGIGPFETLGASNAGQIRNGIYVDEVPEMPWPSRSKRDHTGGGSDPSEVPNGFSSLTPHEAFDSVVDICRIPMVCNTVLPGGTGAYETATDSLWRAIDKVNPAPARNKPELAVAAAHIDFANNLTSSLVPMMPPSFSPPLAASGPQQPWSWRLLRYLTANGHANDFVDNDGNDGAAVSHDDPMDGPNTLFRMAGRININTAPVSVLRSVPFMTNLPDSIQFTQLATMSGNTAAAGAASPYDAYGAYAPPFWDFASAIVAAREGRRVDVRQADVNGVMQLRATCDPGTGAAGRGPFASLGQLACALGTKVNNYPDLVDGSGGNSLMFRADRYVQRPVTGPSLFIKPALMGHRLSAGDVEFTATTPANDFRAFSPDFRYRKAEGAQPETFDYTPVGTGDSDVNPDPDAGGIRGRDIFLSRWANVLTTRSDVFTAYIALIDEDGKYVRRAQVTFDRSNCFGEQRTGGGPSKAVLPDILLREEGSYTDDSR